jgi:Rrf2 family transcriptional regulator, iron-sulfur cluster assembly transcription factor
MLKLSRKSLYALEAVVDIAYNARAEPVQSKEITLRQGIPQRYLEQVMQQLVRAGILKGVRGPRGGYLLARERRRISAGDIVRVIGALETTGEPGEYETESSIGQEVMQPILQDLHNTMMEKLDSITVDDLCTEARANGLRRVGDDNLDFTI